MNRKEIEKIEGKDVLVLVKELLDGLKIIDEDFKEKGLARRGEKRAHEAVIDALEKMWRGKYGFVKEEAKLNIDFIGREKMYGKIVLATEVDTYWDATRNWLKLCDVRADYKAWIYIDSDKDWRGIDVTEQRVALFKKAVEKIKSLLKDRGENEEKFGKFSAYLKTPSKCEMVQIF